MPRLLIIALTILAMVRLILAMTLEVSPEEASLWVAGQRPALGYAAHGPLAPWLVSVGVKMFGAQPLAVRWLGPGLFFLLSVVIWRWACSLFRPKAGAWAVLMINLIPLLQTGLLMGLVYQLSLFFQVTSAWAVWSALRKSGAAWGRWSLAGLSLGLGLLTHASGLVLPMALMFFFMLHSRWRGQLRRAGWWWSLVFAALIASPWAYWLSQQEWLPYHAWIDRHRQWWRWSEVMQGVGKGLGYASPLVVLGVVWAVFLASWHRLELWARRHARFWHSRQASESDEDEARPSAAMTEDPFALAADDLRPTASLVVGEKENAAAAKTPETFWRQLTRTWAHWRSRCAPDLADSELYLLALFWPTLVVALILSARGAQVDLWLTGPIIFGVLLLVGRWLDHGLPTFMARLAQNSVLTLAAVYSLVGMPHDLCRHLGVPLAYTIDPTSRWHGWSQLASEVEDFLRQRHERGEPPVLMMCAEPEHAAVLDFHLPPDVPGVRMWPEQPRIQALSRGLSDHDYAYWPRFDDHGVLSTAEPCAAFIVVVGADSAQVPVSARRLFQQVNPLIQFDLVRGGHELRRVGFFAAQQWQGVK
jgi:hypothetical protein